MKREFLGTEEDYFYLTKFVNNNYLRNYFFVFVNTTKEIKKFRLETSPRIKSRQGATGDQWFSLCLGDDESLDRKIIPFDHDPVIDLRTKLDWPPILGGFLSLSQGTRTPNSHYPPLQPRSGTPPLHVISLTLRLFTQVVLDYNECWGIGELVDSKKIHLWTNTSKIAKLVR